MTARASSPRRRDARRCASSKESIILAVALVGNPRPRVAQRYRAVEDECPFPRIAVHAEVAEPLELNAHAGCRGRKARFRARIAQNFERVAVRHVEKPL